MKTPTYPTHCTDNKTSKTRHSEKIQTVLNKFNQECAVKHFRRPTIRSYRNYSIEYMYYRLGKNDNLTDEAAIKDYLTYLAIEKKVSASTQNVAFNALRFLYIVVLQRPLGQIDATRAKTHRKIPPVFTREEVTARQFKRLSKRRSSRPGYSNTQVLTHSVIHTQRTY